MNILAVSADPRPASFGASLLDHYLAGAASARAITIERADLHAEGFDPRIQESDLAYYQGLGPLPAEIERQQQRIERADTLVLAFPIYWWSLPATLKGWIDRVFTRGWAFGDHHRFSGPLSAKKVRLIATGSGTPRLYEKHGYAAALRSQIEHGILEFSGIRDIQSHFFLDVESSDEGVRLRHLAVARELGQALVEPSHASTASA